MHLWCELFPQATLTLNLLRTSRINPTISSATQLFGQFDVNRTLLAPPGTRAVARVKPKSRRTWAPHGEDAWYVGPVLDHYRCYRVWMVATNRTRIVDTVEFFPQHVKMPHFSSQEMAIQAARELTFALQNPAPAATFAWLGHHQHEALAKLANILKEIAAPEPSYNHNYNNKIRSATYSLDNSYQGPNLHLIFPPAAPLYTSKGGRRRSKGGCALSKGESDSGQSNNAIYKRASYA
jgi:hypothetical protein